MRDPLKSIEKWENSIRRYKAPSDEEWVDIYKEADPAGFARDGEDYEASNILCEFDKIAKTHKVGSASLDFPNSTHGDGCSVDVYVLPKGTTVLIGSATYEREGSQTRIYRGKQIEKMFLLVNELLYDDRDYGDIQDLDEDSEYDPDVSTTYEESKSLRELWISAIPKPKIRPRKAGKADTTPEDIIETMSHGELKLHLINELLRYENSIMEGLEFALRGAMKAGSLAGQKYGSKIKIFQSLVKTAKAIRDLQG
jgi:hypothetical protein